MKKYIDITLIPDSDITLYFIWQKLYQKIHLALVEQQDSDGKVAIGAAFPDYLCDEEKSIYRLGHKLRLFAASSAELETLNIYSWLSRLNDYVHTTSIREVPEHVESYACFKRFQPKSNIERLARRRANKLDIDYKEALCYFSSEKQRKPSEKNHSSLPYINMHSSSTEHYFRLFIEKIESAGKIEGHFNSYGLSSGTTVPWF